MPLAGWPILLAGIIAATGSRRIECLSNFPGTLHVARRDLKIAACQIDADCIAVDTVIGFGDRNIASAGLERDNQFDFMVHILRERRVGDRATIGDDRVGGFGEEKRRGPLVLAHFANVLDVIAADAPDATNGKYFIRPRDGDGCLWRWRNNVAAVGHDNRPFNIAVMVDSPAAQEGNRTKDGCPYQVWCAAVNRMGS